MKKVLIKIISITICFVMLFGNLPLNNLTELNIFKAEAASDSVEKIDVFEFNKYGKMLFNDPLFSSGTNSVGYYDHIKQNITVTRVAKSADCPANTDYMLEIETTGEVNPGCGGFQQTTNSVKGGVFYQVFIAKIPEGFTVQETHNTIGYQAKKTWLTSRVGTGKWETYILKYECGLDFGRAKWGLKFGHIYLTYDSNPDTYHNVKWQVAYAEIFDATGEMNTTCRMREDGSDDGSDISWKETGGSDKCSEIVPYNNKQNGSVTHSLVTVEESPFYGPKTVIQITTDGTASPSYGGFKQSIVVKRGYTYYHKFLAKVPVGYKLENYNNPISGEFTWLTSKEGTGKWETYIYKWDVAPDAVDIQNFGHVAIVPDGVPVSDKWTPKTTETPITWYLAYSNMYRTIENPDFPYAEHYYAGSAYYNNHSYISFNYKTTWTQARDICYKLGGHLATITSAEEQSAVQTLVNANTRYFLGATDFEQEGTWKWITGEPWSYSNWRTSEPDNYLGYEDYLEIVLRDEGCLWGDVDNLAANHERGFICEFDSTACVPAKTMVWNGHTYTLYNASLTWKNAKTACENMGGHLVTITSQAEQDAIRDFVCGQAKGFYWLGATDEVHESRWAWVTGEPFEYSNWATGEPNDQSNNEDYLHLYSRYSATTILASWNDITNDESSGNIGFICEIENTDSTPAKTADFGNNRYLRIDTIQPWATADELSRLSGGHLVTITSQEEQDVINNLISDGSQYYWNGCYSPKQNGESEWITGEPLEYNHWVSGEPNNKNNIEFYVMINKASEGRWNDVTARGGTIGGVGYIIELENVRGSKDDYSWAYDGNTLTVSGSGDISGIEAEINAGWFSLIKNVVVNSDDITLSADTFKETDWYKSLPDGIIYIGNALYGYKGIAENGTALVIADGTTTIADKAFENQNGISSVSVPGTVNTIGENSFCGCTNIKTVSGCRNSEAEILAEKLEADFVSLTSTVTFNANGGILEKDSVVIERNTALSSAPVPQKTGYEFIGWFTEKTDGIPADDSYLIQLDCELYAHWKKINSLSIVSQPEKNEYTVGDSFDPAGMRFEVIYSDGTSAVIGPENIIFSQNQFLRPGGKIVIADYCGIKASFYVQVNAGMLDSLSVSSLPDKTEYSPGEDLDTKGLKLIAVYDNEQSVSVNSGYELSYDFSTPGIKTVTVTYTLNGVTVLTSFEVTVTEPSPMNDARIFSDTIEAESGGRVLVPVYIENNEGFMGFDIGLRYDDSILTPVSVSAGSMLGDGILNDSIGYSEPGFINAVFFGSKNVTEDGTLFTVEFSVISSSDCSTVIFMSYDERDTFNTVWDPIVLECSEIAVNVSAQEIQTALTISFGEAVIEDGGVVMVPIVVDGSNGVYSFGFEVNYDEDMLRFISSDLTLAQTDSENRKLMFFVSNYRISDKTVLGELAFNVISADSGYTTLNFSGVTVVNQSGESQTVLTSMKRISMEGVSPAVPTIYSEKVYAHPGDTVELPIMIKNNSGLMGIALLVEYDPALLNPVGIRSGTVFSSGSFDSNEGLKCGEYKIIWYGNSQVEADGSLAVLNFTLSENVSESIPVNITVMPQDTFNESWEGVEVTVEDIEINLNNFYSVTFVSRGNVVSVKKYILADPSVTEPAVPKLPGLLNGRWESYDLSNGGDVTVNALYDNPSIFLPAHITLSADDKRRAIVSANFVVKTKEWKTYDSGVAVIDGNGNIIAVAEGECTISVICTGTDEIGNTFRVTDTMRVTVKTAKTGISLKENIRSSFNDFFRYTLHDIINNFVKAILRYLLPFYNKSTE